jgi:hypothetical protein
MGKSKIREELLNIAREHRGIIQPSIVVAKARDARSPLHSCFEWDNSKAAEAFRLEQARGLIRTYVTVISEENHPQDVFVSLSTDRKTGGGYRILADVINDGDMKKILLKDALDEMIYFTNKYNRLQELSSVIEAMNKVIATVKKMKRKG